MSNENLVRFAEAFDTVGKQAASPEAETTIYSFADAFISGSEPQAFGWNPGFASMIEQTVGRGQHCIGRNQRSGAMAANFDACKVHPLLGKRMRFLFLFFEEAKH